MLELQKYDQLAVRAAFNALVISFTRTRKGRKKLAGAIRLLRSQASARNVVPICAAAPVATNHDVAGEAVLYLEDIRAQLDTERR